MWICRKVRSQTRTRVWGEHRDPGWLFRAYGEEIRRSGDVPDHAGERITHSPVVTLCQFAKRHLASGNSNAAIELSHQRLPEHHPQG
jgi:hypothetical protein